MRTGATFLSAIIHAGFIAGGLLVFQAEPEPVDASTMITIPLELVTIGDKTDIAPVTKDAKIDDEAKEEEAEPVAAAAAPPPPPEPDSVAIEDAQPPKKAEEKKAEVKPAPPKSNVQERSDFIDSLALTGAKPTPPKKAAASGDKSSNTTNEAPRMGAGEQRKMVASITDYIRSQLVKNQCWTDHSDMADAQRLKVTFRVWFGTNNRFSRPYELQTREPSGDPPLQVFVQHARRALDKCNTIGWVIPQEYFKLPQPQYIDITFVPQVGAMQ